MLARISIGFSVLAAALGVAVLGDPSLAPLVAAVTVIAAVTQMLGHGASEREQAKLAHDVEASSRKLGELTKVVDLIDNLCRSLEKTVSFLLSLK